MQLEVSPIVRSARVALAATLGSSGGVHVSCSARTPSSIDMQHIPVCSYMLHFSVWLLVDLSIV